MANILLFYHFPEVVAGTSIDHLDAFAKYSKHNIFLVNSLTAKYSFCRRSIPATIDLNWFDALLIHYSIYMPSESMIDSVTRTKIRAFQGKKIAFIQDEYRQVNIIHDCLNDLEIDVLYTCLPMPEIEKVYPDAKLPGLKKINTLTGYVSENLSIKRKTRRIADRFIDVGYRARKLSAWYGELAQEKTRIGDGFLEHNTRLRTGLKCDISCEENDRIYGEKWIEFIQSCRCMLGVESGASVFDFTGEIQEAVEYFEAANPNVSFDEIKELFFKEIDGEIYLNQISPRCFESIALKTPLILFKGNYSGILLPWRHYIPLEKDFSNFMEVVHCVRDDDLLQNIAESAYQDIVASGRYSYRQFMSEFDSEMDRELGESTTRFAMSTKRFFINFLVTLEIGISPVLYISRKIVEKPHLKFYTIAARAYSFLPHSIRSKPWVIKVKSKLTRRRFKR